MIKPFPPLSPLRGTKRDGFWCLYCKKTLAPHVLNLFRAPQDTLSANFFRALSKRKCPWRPRQIPYQKISLALRNLPGALINPPPPFNPILYFITHICKCVNKSVLYNIFLTMLLSCIYSCIQPFVYNQSIKAKPIPQKQKIHCGNVSNT